MPAAAMVSDTLLVVNPESGRGDHLTPVTRHAAERGYGIAFTQGAGDAVDIAAAAIEAGVEEIVAVGGDGTLNEVVRGAHETDSLEEVTIGVIPAGTGNDFAGNIGIDSIEAGFHALAAGERRRLDLGLADGRPFVNSCIAGITAEASADTSPGMKSRLGVLAYVVTTLRSLTDFEGMPLSVHVPGDEGAGPAWDGSAAMVLVGNGRRFTMTGGGQADVEDGLLEVTIVEDASSIELLGDGARQLFGDVADRFIRLRAPSLELSVQSSSPANFSLDGEMSSRESIRLSIVPRVMQIPVGGGYEPNPERRTSATSG